MRVGGSHTFSLKRQRKSIETPKKITYIFIETPKKTQGKHRFSWKNIEKPKANKHFH
jgi:hypothetical protein